MAARHSFVEVVSLVSRIFEAQAFSRQDAQVLAANCVTAEADGSASHGLFRVAHYVATIKSGYASARADPIVDDIAPGVLRVDADNGFALLAVRKAAAQLAEKCRANGIAVMQVHNSHHLGALYLDIESFAREGFIALAMVSSGALVAPPGGKRAVYGTNPMAFATPRQSGDPVFFDQSSSTMAYGEVELALREGRTLRNDTGIDFRGNSTGDPNEILNGGALSTFGGHKGASVALLIEVLCSGLVGADFSFQVSRDPGAKTSRTGETIIIIDPSIGRSETTWFPSRVDDLAAALKAAGQDRIPGERRLLARKQALSAGIEIEGTLWSTLNDLARLAPATNRSTSGTS